MNKGLKIALIVAGVFILLIGGITTFAMLSGESSKNNEQNPVKSTGSADEIRYTLKLNNQLPLPANADQDIKFNILNQTGEVQKDFVVKDTKLAYVYFLRTDINKLIVVSPEFNKETGEFTIKKPTGKLKWLKMPTSKSTNLTQKVPSIKNSNIFKR